MHTYKLYKEQAVKSLSGSWGMCATITLFANLIPLLVLYVPLISYVLLSGSDYNSFIGFVLQIPFYLIAIPLSWGNLVYFLTKARREPTSFGILFKGFQDNYWRIFSSLFLLGIYVGLWSCVLIVPGIVKFYSYSMTPYVLADEPDLCRNAAIERSMEMMRGKKKELFLLDLSMIGWIILNILTLGIASLFTHPYINTVHAHFYEGLKAKRDNNDNQDDDATTDMIADSNTDIGKEKEQENIVSENKDNVVGEAPKRNIVKSIVANVLWAIHCTFAFVLKELLILAIGVGIPCILFWIFWLLFWCVLIYHCGAEADLSSLPTCIEYIDPNYINNPNYGYYDGSKTIVIKPDYALGAGAVIGGMVTLIADYIRLYKWVKKNKSK